MDKEGERYYKYGTFSKEDTRAVDENTLFEIGSITKTFTGILLADMHLKGEVNKDDPLEKYLPKGVKVPEYDGTKITLMSLSVQNSGLPRMPINFVPKDAQNPFAHHTWENIYEVLNQYKLTRKPGEKFGYSNLGVGLLGHALVLKTGKSFEELVTERILGHLEMNDTKIILSDEYLKRTAIPLNYGLTPAKLWDFQILGAAGAMKSTAMDMIKYLKANMGITESPLVEAMALSQKDLIETGRPGDRIGFNWFTTEAKGTKIIWHNGGTGGFRSFAGFSKEKGVGVVVWTNCIKPADDIGFKLLMNAE